MIFYIDKVRNQFPVYFKLSITAQNITTFKSQLQKIPSLTFAFLSFGAK